MRTVNFYIVCVLHQPRKKREDKFFHCLANTVFYKNRKRELNPHSLLVTVILIYFSKIQQLPVTVIIKCFQPDMIQSSKIVGNQRPTLSDNIFLNSIEFDTSSGNLISKIREHLLRFPCLDADYEDVVYFSHVRWLSRAATLKRFWNLLPEIKQFLVMKHRDITLLENYEWLNDLAFLIDITQMLSDLNLKLQGKDQLVHKMFEHVESFLARLMLIKNQLLSKKTTHLSTLSERVSESIDHDKYCGLLEKLEDEFENRCQDFKKAKIHLAMFSDPFTVNAETAQDEFQFELLDLQSNSGLKTAHRENSLLDFYKKYLSLEKLSSSVQACYDLLFSFW